LTRRLTSLAGAVLVLVLPALARAGAELRVDLGADPSAQIGPALKMILVLTVLSVAPAILLATTSFLRIAVVFAFIRSALGIQGMPPNQVLMGLAVFLTVAIMMPVGSELYQAGLEPYLDGELPAGAAYERGVAPLRTFMLRQTREDDLALFYDMHRVEYPSTPADVGMHLLVPAFIISELRTAFEMGFLLLIPFLLLDVIVSALLMSMGMVMLPPALISLPIKVGLFVVADGWHLLVASLVRSFS
jgi:flagellar biosynthetic protein FliP